MGKLKPRNIRCRTSFVDASWVKEERCRDKKDENQIKCHYGILSFGKEGPALWIINCCKLRNRHDSLAVDKVWKDGVTH